jgi:hypothetical protein
LAEAASDGDWAARSKRGEAIPREGEQRLARLQVLEHGVIGRRESAGICDNPLLLSGSERAVLLRRMKVCAVCP